MSTHCCTTAWCVLPSDFKTGDLALCSKCFKRHADWEGAR